MEGEIVRITEGGTVLAVPAASLSGPVPPRTPAFFNPRAKRTRDLAVRACGAHLGTFEGPKTYLDAMAGTGARGIRMARELDFETVYVNDANPEAVSLAREGAAVNGLDNVSFSEKEACRFLSDHSTRGERGAVVDTDPFGSPAPYLDCAIRATAHGGMLAVTATDLQVLGGLHNDACRRIYGGIPVRTCYMAETAVRLILGCISSVAGRLDKGVSPLYAENHMHYYRVYARLLRSPGERQMGYLLHCPSCGHRQASADPAESCGRCGGAVLAAGPLWIGNLFEREFVNGMILCDQAIRPEGAYGSMLGRCLDEAEMPAAFYTLDEIASRIRSGPPQLAEMVRGLLDAGFAASVTSFSFTGFRTDADIGSICEMARSLKSHAHQV